MRLGPWEIALIVLAVVILFGAKKIPEIMRGLGLGVKEFKSGLRDDDETTTGKPDKNDKNTSVEGDKEESEPQQ